MYVKWPGDRPVVELEARVEFIIEGVAIDGLSTPPCACGVPSLRHEPLVNPEEGRSVVVALQAQLHEITHSLRA